MLINTNEKKIYNKEAQMLLNIENDNLTFVIYDKNLQNEFVFIENGKINFGPRNKATLFTEKTAIEIINSLGGIKFYGYYEVKNG